MEKEVEKETQFIETKPSGWIRFLGYTRIIISFGLGCWITWLLYTNCLHCSDCHIVVTAHMSLLALICFVNCCVPVDKIIKISGITGG